MGLGKKVLIANNVSIAADGIFRLPASQLTSELAWVGIGAYSLQIYFDFFGYSDMAIGLGRMFGFELPVNFRYPYWSHSVQEFWRRWHISMSSWFRDYVYLPLGGNRLGTGRTYLNLTAVFFLCGLWHGASWTFVAWGLYHGLFLVLERLAKPLPFPRILGYAYTLVVVMGGWVLFRSDTFGNALTFYRALAGMGSGISPYSVGWFVTPDVGLALAAGVLFAMPVVPAMSNLMERYASVAPAFAVVRMVYTMAILFACTLSLASGTHNPFLYFRF